MLAWHTWRPVDEIPSHRLPDTPSVYCLRLVDGAGRPVPIPRFLATDEEGILHIGRARSIRRRLLRFHEAMRRRRARHAEGKLAFFLMRNVEAFARRIEEGEWALQYSYAGLSTPSEAKREEERLLKCYFRRFGEVPPLNRELPHGMVRWQDLSCEGE
ncbi:hypothetical protein [Spirochaeta thermophila]|uniref:GIY-YIG domain-containing protein n=1 Tax=Winmispira thermophila (strain ATCC 49972 / DSM 6192 / RI 19.B1) TaxID=665571 RepID=E0RNP7_WINT6|nr:hypothetical protein [Spirochaeta thermophila]ADN02638.1 hypothetical protein STHERM_c17020 [Spirochaeta thermophila DSM 6192]